MAGEKASRSIRMSVLVFIGVCFVLFAVLLFSVFYLTMPRMLLRSEQSYLTKQLEMLTGLMREAERNTYVMADDTGIWEETVRFVAGNNPDYIRNNWPDASPLATYRFNFMIIKDADGNDLYVEFLDYAKNQPLPVPDGFTDHLTRFSQKTLDIYKKPIPENAALEDLGQGGLIFYQGTAYFLAVMPIMETRESGIPVGTLTMGHVLNANYFKDMTHIETATFDYITPEAGNYAQKTTITRESDSLVSTLLPLKDIDGRSVLLRMSDSRPIYLEGRTMLYRTALIMLVMMAAFGLLFYLALNICLIRPIETLSRDIEDNSFSVDVPPDTYSRSREFISLCTAISDMLRRLDQSKISIEVMQSILNGLDSLIFVTDPTTDEVLFMNDFMRKQEASGETGVGYVCWKVMHKNMSGRCADCPKNQLEKAPDTAVAWENQHPATGRYYHNTDRLIPWAGGRKVHLRHSVDITQRKEAEAELLRMSAVVVSSPHCIYFFDLNGNFEYYNPSALSTFGFSDQDLAGKNISAVLSPEAFAYAQDVVIPQIVKKGQVDFEIPVAGKDGTIHIMAFSGFATHGNPMGLGAIASDITEKRQLEKDLVAAKEVAERSSQAKGDFLSRMSHEMRTPLNAIIGMTSIAKSSDTLEKKIYCLDKIEDASNHLLGLINDILDMSKIEANKFELTYTDFVFEKMLMRVVNVVNYRMDEKEQNFVIHVDKEVPYAIVSDEQRLSQVITNLLANAAKFTPEKGTITLSVRTQDQQDDVCTLRIEVSDTGIGIPPEQQERLFNPFEQADGGISRKFGGTGLGLSISRSIIELMGGSIGVTSEAGKGSTFGITLKVKIGATLPPEILCPEINWKSLRILVVDDAPEVREYFLNLCASIGLSCQVAKDGADAIAVMEENRDHPFNMVFVDWKMPGMNGIELTKKIKTHYGADVVVIMISAMGWDAIEQEARAAGVDRFISKPLFSSVIWDSINTCLGASQWLHEEVESPIVKGCFAGYRILLAEDIDINREIVISLLQDTGLAIDSARNGAEACRRVEADPAAYDMIFMDIHMPEMDGYEATRHIRASNHPRLKTIPIVAMTANVFREDIEKCLAAGMDDHIGKPVNLKEIHEILKRYLPVSRAGNKASA
ncbi:response regulator [Desulfosarcina sp. OttesenSCG-928-B08]|nr:response regulator [Desulfosarcina sp. OttesenSCG-928-B08]